MEHPGYTVHRADQLETPALLYYKDIILRNTERAIRVAGNPRRLWPHVKSHKMGKMIRLQMNLGIERFKCATIAEMEMVAQCGAAHILMAYPLIGPNMARFLALRAEYPKSAFYAIGDDEAQLTALSTLAQKHGQPVRMLLDLNMGMNRTGVPLRDAHALYRKLCALPGLSMEGLHAYDGHSNQADPAVRREAARPAIEAVHALRRALREEGMPCAIVVGGGTPSFPIHADYDESFLSPGTVFLADYRYASDLTDLALEPGVLLLTRVVSHPAPGLFTIDLGSKGISQDSPGRGVLLGVPGASALFQSEEHWVYEMTNGQNPPPIGTALYVVPMHVCPTNALYPYAHIIEDGQVVDRWEITARDRKLTF